MSQPPELIHPSFSNHVCKLNKAIYELKQANCVWHNKLRHYLLSKGFKPTISDPSLFHSSSNNSPIYLIVYVDDIIIMFQTLLKLINLFSHSLLVFHLKIWVPILISLVLKLSHTLMVYSYLKVNIFMIFSNVPTF